ncbi:MAG: SxtJ family membrane protein [Candidatus Omnitrophica bacterium]|nr:SxtJ family membrane protein [Candidatus Omnitrophota bacterium]MDD5591960.1 SxtJ family membrane protein [Candidatus Omnitrophota bacterium]
MEKLKLDKNNLKKFGITMGIAFFIIALLLVIRHKHNSLPVFLISAIFFIFAFTLQVLLKSVYIFWMKLAYVLSWINTRLILLIMFYLILTPIGLIMKLFKVDLLYLKTDKKRQSYWREREKKLFSPLNYERQF